ncbi:MAG: efflux RND transporter periplasmic adaptor subunit [Paenibacillaceae bacterium]
MIKSNRYWVNALMVGLSLVVLSGCSLLPMQEEPLAPPLVKPVKQNYTTVEAKKGTIISSVKGLGTFEPVNVVYHQFKEDGGKLKEVLVKSGDIVKKGDPLIQLEVDGLDIEIKYKLLDLEKAKVGLETAKLDRNEAQMKLKLLELDIAQLQYERTLNKLQSRQLKAGMDGQVIFVADVEPPNYVEPYLVLVSVADITQLRVAYESGAMDLQLSSVMVGMEAEVTWEEEKIHAVVTQTPSTAPITQDQQLRERNAKLLYLELDKVPDKVEIGNFADIMIVTKKKDNVLILPARALRSFLGRNYVQILDGERISELDVEVGIKTVTEVEIMNGLEEGQQIILP